MELQKIHIENKVTSEVRIEIFDTYAESYNECTNKMERINFTSNLSTLQTGYSKQLVDLNNRIEKNLNVLKKRLENVKHGNYENVIVDGGEPEPVWALKPYRDDYLTNNIEHLITFTQNSINDIKNNYGSSNIDRLKAGFNGLFREIIKPFRSREVYFRLLQDTLNLANKYGTLKTHVDNLNTILNEIGVNNYPDEIKAYNERSKKEKSEIVITKDKNKKLKTGTPEFWDYVEELLSKISKEYNGDKLKKVYKSLEKQWDKYGIYGYNSFESFKASFYKAGRSVDVN